MKNRGICRKCRSRDIVRIDGSTEGGTGVIFLSMGGLEAVALTRFLCCQCGYSEEWLDKEEMLERVKRRYKARFKPTHEIDQQSAKSATRWEKLKKDT